MLFVIDYLVSALEINQVLRELFLADNKLMPTDGIQLGHMLKVNHTLQLLDVRNNHMQVYFHMLSHMYNCAIMSFAI